MTSIDPNKLFPNLNLNLPSVNIGSNTSINTDQLSKSSNSFKNAKGVDSAYQIKIWATDSNGALAEDFPIIAALPERYNIAVSSQWDTPFADKTMASAITSGSNEAAINAALGAVGIGQRLQYSFAQVWQSTSPLTFNTDIVLNATTDTDTEVRRIHRTLLKLVCPSFLSNQVGVLAAPGPVLVSIGQDMKGRNITILLGDYLKLEHVIIKSVSSDVRTICDKKGYPTNVSINIEFESFYQGMTTQDIDKMFNKVTGGSGAAGITSNTTGNGLINGAVGLASRLINS